MYDMYPEWGPAHLDEDHPANPANPANRSGTALQTALDRRDNGGDRPEDN